MKKLLYTLLVVSIIFSACKKENEEPSNTNNNNPSSIIGYGWGNDTLYKTTDGGVTWNFVNILISDNNFSPRLSFGSEDIGVFGGFHYVGWNGNWEPYYSMNWSVTVSGGLGFTSVSNWNNAAGNGGASNLGGGGLIWEAEGNMFYCRLAGSELTKMEIANDATISTSSTSPESFSFISFVDDNIGYAGGGNIYKTTDGGNTWNSIANTSLSVNSLSFPSENIGYATSNDNWLYKTTDGGNNWFQLTQIDINNMEFVTDNIGYGFFSNMLYQTTDGGVNWSMINDNSIGLSLLSFIN
jgi:photosystem II stability/assembly factor-like uncharacterized protein